MSPKLPLAFMRNGLQVLQQHLHLPVESGADYDYDAIFVAIDTENPSSIQQSRLDVGSQLGVAILDTRILALCMGKPKNIIKTHNFVLGSSSYQQKAADRFLLGESSILTSHQRLAFSLESLISPRKRDIILVGNGIVHDLQILHRLGFDLCTSIIGALDTAQIARQSLIPTSTVPKLCNLLTALQCPFYKLHSAGNDTHFTMRALLLLAARSYEASAGALKPRDHKKIRFVKAVASVRLPRPRLTASERNRKSKIQRKLNMQEKCGTLRLSYELERREQREDRRLGMAR